MYHLPCHSMGKQSCPSACKSMMNFWICECKICYSRCHVFPSVVSWETTWNTLIYLCNPSVSQVPGLAVEIGMSPVRNGWSETGTAWPLGATSYRGQVSRTASMAVMWQWQVVKRANIKSEWGEGEEKSLVISQEIFKRVALDRMDYTHEVFLRMVESRLLTVYSCTEHSV